MLQTNRHSYFLLIISIIILGTLSRKTDGVPTFFGDTLYAVMSYFGMRFFFVGKSAKKAIAFALAFCFCIEFLQLYRAEWLLAVRRTTLGHYALGQGFLWSDLGYYTFGIIIAYLIDSYLINRD